MALIAIIDYDMGNLRNVERALTFAGADVRIVRSPSEAAGVHFGRVNVIDLYQVHFCDSAVRESMYLWYFSFSAYIYLSARSM